MNKDIKVSDLLHYNAIKIRVKHFDHLFSIYIKAKGTDTVCRVEENKHFKKPLIDSINNIFNSIEELKKQIAAIYDIVSGLAGQGQLANRTNVTGLLKEETMDTNSE